MRIYMKNPMGVSITDYESGVNLDTFIAIWVI